MQFYKYFSQIGSAMQIIFTVPFQVNSISITYKTQCNSVEIQLRCIDFHDLGDIYQGLFK